MSEPAEQTIFSHDDISRTLARISHEIIENNSDLSKLIIIGIHTRGVPLAKRLADNIKNIKGVEIPLGKLDITFYRDDISAKGADLTAERTNIPDDLSGKTIVLVDDVLFTGRSIRAAVDHLIDFGRPAKIRLAILIDRGHRELPIRPDYIGKNFPTSKNQHLQVKMTETDGEDKVLLIND